MCEKKHGAGQPRRASPPEIQEMKATRFQYEISYFREGQALCVAVFVT
jgi:hypothetical protein